MEGTLRGITNLGLAAAGIGFVGQFCLYNGERGRVGEGGGEGRVVEGGKRAVIFDRFRGVLPTVFREGTHLKIPIVQVGEEGEGKGGAEGGDRNRT